MRTRPAARGRRLLLVGVSVRALAASVIASRSAPARFPGGIVALDYFGDADHAIARGGARCELLSLRRDLGCRRDVPALVDAALALRWDACVYAGGIENHPVAIERLGRIGRVIGNDAGTVRAVRDPRRLFAALRLADLPHPRTLIPAPAAAPRRGSWIWKRRRSGAGLGVHPARPGSPRPAGCYLQEFVPGLPASIVFVADATGARLIGGSLMLAGFEELGGGGFLYGGSVAGPLEAWLPAAARARLETAAANLTRTFGLRGINGIDFILRDGIPYLIEVNPRYTASTELLEERAGRSVFDLHLAACEGRPAAAPAGDRPGAPPFLGKGILYADRPVRGGDPRLLASIGCRDIPVRGEAIDPGEPVCTVIAPGSTPADCRRRLVRLASRVRAVFAAPCGTIQAHPRVPRGSRRISVRPVARGAQHGNRAGHPAGTAGTGRRLPGPGARPTAADSA